MQDFNATKLDQAIRLFGEYRKSDRYRNDSEDRTRRTALFQDLIKKPFDEAVLTELIKKLWAAQIFGNKQYLVDQILKKNSLLDLEKQFALLRRIDLSPEDKYASFLGSVKGMGPSMVTELICYLDPKHAGIWNDKARKALAWLEARHLPISKYRIDKDEYRQLNEFLQAIAERLQKASYKDVDLLLVDYLLWEVWEQFVKKDLNFPSLQKDRDTKSKSRHDELISKLVEIGSWLGFEAESEKPIAIGSRVDSVWKAKIANLGSVAYVFEVQDRGSIDSLILNLQRSQTNPTVQKLVIVSDNDQIARIKKELETMPETLRKSCAFWEDTEVDATHESLQQVSAAIAKLNLVNE